jgi:hypothetical protein
MLKKAFFFGLIMIVGFSVVMISRGNLIEGSAHDPEERHALIIIVNLTYTDTNEMSKAVSLQYYLFDMGFCRDNIMILSPGTGDEVEGIANLSNVRDGFERLALQSDFNDEVLIYVSDHSTQGMNSVYYRFTDGNMSSVEMDGYLDDIIHKKMTFVMCGNQSGLAGLTLSQDDRDIISSMGESDFYNPDEYNITRGLRDPYADSNDDGGVTYIEATESERKTMAEYTTQFPRIWEGKK